MSGVAGVNNLVGKIRLTAILALISVRTCAAQNYTISTVAGAGWGIPGLSANLSNLEGLDLFGGGAIGH
jgi:hypothetical protein